MKHKGTKGLYRVVAMLLCIAMVLPYIPDLVLPTRADTSTVSEETVYVLAASDFQGTYSNSTHNTANIVSTMKQIIAKTGRTSFDSFMFMGDYNLGSDDQTVTGLNTLKSALSGYSFNQQFFLQGNHDPAPASGNGLTATGGYVGQYYDVYVLNWEVYGESTSDSAVQKQANALNSWLNERTVGDKPVFVLAHMPLHYSQRTSIKGDARFSDHLVDVLNAAGQRGLNIIFMYGHNHSGGYDRYLGGSTNFVSNGESLWIPDRNNVNNDPKERVINFTYMNAGYLGTIADTASTTDSANTMTVFEITGDDVTVRRYDVNGEHALQGYQGSWWDYAAGTDDSGYGYQPDLKPQASGMTLKGTNIELDVSDVVSHYNFAVGSHTNISVKNGASAEYTWEVVSVVGSDVAAITTMDNAIDTVTIEAWNPGVVKLVVTNNTTKESFGIYIQVEEMADEMIVETTSVNFYRLVTQFAEGQRYMLINFAPSGVNGANTSILGKANAITADGSGTG